MLRTLPLPRFSRPLALAALLTLGAAAQASTPDCDATGKTLDCRLNQVLHLLDATAVILVLVLIVALLVALQVYRRNRSQRKDRRP
jgi:hypothetical protein